MALNIIRVTLKELQKHGLPFLTGSSHSIKLQSKLPYDIKIKWGEFDPLFKGDCSDTRGRQERMMALGFFYDTIDGINGPITERCWQYMKEEMEHQKNAPIADMEAHLAQQMNTVVQKDNGSRDHESDPEKDMRIMYPGSFTFSGVNQLGNPLTSHRKNEEDKAWKKNRGLGRVPLIVEVVDRVTGEKAEGVKICFEYIDPFANPDDQKIYLDSISDVTERSNSPRSYVTANIARDASLPFGFNCTDGNGGRKPTDVHGTLIAKGKVHGFPHKVTTSGRPNKFSVVGITNDQGETGAVLRPARTAGDCFKLKVYVLEAPEPRKAVEEKTTGLMTVWRNQRVSKIIIKQPVPGYSGAPPVNASLQGALGSISTSDISTEYAKAFHDAVIDKDAETPLVLTAANYLAAINAATAEVSNPRKFDLDALVNTGLSSPFLFWLADDVTYNANRKANSRSIDLTKANTWGHISGLLNELMDSFMKHFTNKAVPGVMVIRSEIGDSYSYWAHPKKPANWMATTSGVATIMRGCYLWYPNSVYNTTMPYPVTTNAMHEMGHVLFLRHHYTSGKGATASGGFSANHDSQDDCIMGYMKLTTNDFCGKCLLKLRGWDESKF